MRLYGELKPGALEHLSSKVIGYAADRREQTVDAPVSTALATTTGRALVWDEEKGAHFLRDE